nr:MAG TPA: hypothetical protein [Caudoviricetes sp.]
MISNTNTRITYTYSYPPVNIFRIFIHIIHF